MPGTEQNTGNTLFPIFLKLDKFSVLIVGGGTIALEKVNAVLGNSPLTKVTLVAKSILQEITEIAKQFPNIKLLTKGFEESDMNDKNFIVSAVNDKELSKEICRLANKKNILINVADTPDLCDFYLSSIVKKGDLKIAISTNGKSPTMAKRVKEVLNDFFPDETQDILDNLNKIRTHLKSDFKEKVKQLNEITSVLVDKLDNKK